MPIVEPVIRPPAEADSFLLQVTVGCSANECSFCGAYRNKPFRVKPYEEILSDLRTESRDFPNERRVFLLDGDALALSNSKLLPILSEIRQAFPQLSRIASYANGFNITGRNSHELKALYENQLKLIYLGLESGSQDVLNRMKKRSTADEMVRAVQMAQSAGIKVSVIVLLGLGGKMLSELHVEKTIQALNQMQPRYLSFLSLMFIPNTLLYQEVKRGDFQALNPGEILREMYQMIKGLKLTKTIFRSDHASNYLPLEGRFPQDQTKLMRILESAMERKIPLRPEFMRGL